jgi:hypothetical protein
MSIPNKNASLIAGTTSKATPINDLGGNINQQQQYSPCLMCESKPTFLNTFEQYEPLIPLCRDCVDKIYSNKGQEFANKVIRKAKAEARK